MDVIAKNLAGVQERIHRAAQKSGRKASDITLVGVTKTIDAARVQRLYDLGVVNLGENRVQELCAKYPLIQGEPVWHMIGHLQTNKVKHVIGKVSMIHSVDSVKLGEEIDRQAAKAGIIMNVLIEVNIAQERTKEGVAESGVRPLLERLLALPHIKVKGLMTVARYVENEEDNRNDFFKMKRLFVDLAEEYADNMNMGCLSMGMTNDYEVAIEEGATMIRIGTGLFGSRL